MVDKFRIKQVTGALSQGLGLFAAKKGEEEKRAAEKAWEESMMRLKEKFASEREARQEAADQTRFETGQAGALERTQMQIGAQAEQGRLGREARREEFDLDQVQQAEKLLFSTLQDYREQHADAVEQAFGDQETIDRLQAQLGGLIDDAIVGHVVRLASNEAPGYEVKRPEDLAAKFQMFGMDPGGAKEFSVQIGGALWPDLIPEPEAGGFTPGQGGGYVMGPDDQGAYTGAGQRWDESQYNPINMQPETAPAIQQAQTDTDPVAAGASLPVDMIADDANAGVGGAGAPTAPPMTGARALFGAETKNPNYDPTPDRLGRTPMFQRTPEGNLDINLFNPKNYPMFNPAWKEENRARAMTIIEAQKAAAQQNK